MKGAIEYLRAVRDICKDSNLNCDKCPLMNASEYSAGCPIENKPAFLTDEDILFMVKLPERVKNERATKHSS